MAETTPLITPLIAATQVSRTYQSGRVKTHALKEVTLSVAQGEALAVVGQSGAGKTTLAAILIGRLKPTTGRVLFEGQDVTNLTGKHRREFWRSVQMVTQDASLAFRDRQTVASVLAEPLRNFDLVPKSEQASRIGELLETVGLPRTYAVRHCGELSGGEQQRVSLARALAPQPRLLILDEATSALDVSTQARLIDTINDIRASSGLTLITICHDLSVAQRLAERIVVMHHGTIEVELSSNELATCSNPYVRTLVEASFSLDEPRGSMFRK